MKLASLAFGIVRSLRPACMSDGRNVIATSNGNRTLGRLTFLGVLVELLPERAIQLRRCARRRDQNKNRDHLTRQSLPNALPK